MNIRTVLPVIAVTVALGAGVVAPASAGVKWTPAGRTWSAPASDPIKKMKVPTPGTASPLYRGPGGWSQF